MNNLHDFPVKLSQLLIGLGFALILLAGIAGLSQLRMSQEELADRLAPGMLRLHILANSDSAEDQKIKLEIRSLLLDTLSSQLSESDGKEETIRFLTDNQQLLAETATACLRSHGFPYSAAITLARDYFPTRVYDRLVIPCGVYDAVRITLGKGQGHNWWCVLYPRFCFADARCSDVPELSRSLLFQPLKKDDVLALEDHRPNLKLRFFFLETAVGTPVSK